jgi:hypothetical protein
MVIVDTWKSKSGYVRRLGVQLKNSYLYLLAPERSDWSPLGIAYHQLVLLVKRRTSMAFLKPLIVKHTKTGVLGICSTSPLCPPLRVLGPLWLPLRAIESALKACIYKLIALTELATVTNIMTIVATCSSRRFQSGLISSVVSLSPLLIV